MKNSSKWTPISPLCSGTAGPNLLGSDDLISVQVRSSLVCLVTLILLVMRRELILCCSLCESYLGHHGLGHVNTEHRLSIAPISQRLEHHVLLVTVESSWFHGWLSSLQQVHQYTYDVAVLDIFCERACPRYKIECCSETDKFGYQSLISASISSESSQRHGNGRFLRNELGAAVRESQDPTPCDALKMPSN